MLLENLKTNKGPGVVNPALLQIFHKKRIKPIYMILKISLQ